MKIVLPVSYADTLYNKTGDWRTLTPEFGKRIASCVQNCPLNQDIPKILDLIAQEKWKEAYYLITEKNPFPAICGRVCYSECEKNCNRSGYDESLSIREIEGSIGDLALTSNLTPIFPTSIRDERVLIIGAGIAGLASAYFLRKNSIQAKIFEKNYYFGGLARIIPAFRLLSRTLELEVGNFINAPGIGLSICTPISKNFLERAVKLDHYQAIVLATGSQPRKLDIPGAHHALPAEVFLRYMKIDWPKIYKACYDQCRKIAVIGGGNTAIDTALVCRHYFPDSKVEMIMPETYQNMPAFEEGKQEAVKSGIEIFPDSKITLIEKNAGAFDLRFQTSYGDYFKRGFGLVISAIGRELGQTLLSEADSLWYEDKIFLAGDLCGNGSVAESITSARRAVEKIIPYLANGKRNERAELEIDRRHTFLKQQKSAQPNWAYFQKKQRIKNNPEEESNRCVRCGTCLNCDNCLNFCPDAAVCLLGSEASKYEVYFNYDYCKGCLICAQECPTGAITVQEEGNYDNR